MLYFSTRDKARKFANGSKKVVDLGKGWGQLRWAVKVTK